MPSDGDVARSHSPGWTPRERPAGYKHQGVATTNFMKDKVRAEKKAIATRGVIRDPARSCPDADTKLLEVSWRRGYAPDVTSVGAVL